MLIHLARISVVTIALALVVTVAFLFARPQTPTVITVVVPPQTPAIVTAPAPAAAPTTVVHHTAYPWWYGCRSVHHCY
jgi:hypothetical protein